MLDKILQFIAEKLKCLPVANGGTGVTTTDDVIKNFGFRTKEKDVVLIGKNLTNGKNIYAYDCGDIIKDESLNSDNSYRVKSPKITTSAKVLYSYFFMGIGSNVNLPLPQIDVRSDVAYHTYIEKIISYSGYFDVIYKNNYPSWYQYNYALYGFIVFESEV